MYRRKECQQGRCGDGSRGNVEREERLGKKCGVYGRRMNRRKECREEKAERKLGSRGQKKCGTKRIKKGRKKRLGKKSELYRR